MKNEQCPFGDDCDLTAAYLAGAARGRTENTRLRELLVSALARIEELEAALREIATGYNAVGEKADFPRDVAHAALTAQEAPDE